MRIHRRGFSLMEMAVVLAIVGLLVGGIIAGRSMIRTAQVRSVLTDANMYINAQELFREQYGQLPGDFSTATNIWGRADSPTTFSGQCAQPNRTAAVGKATCNGNGDETLNNDAHEGFRSWQHLTAAGFIQGRYTGTDGVDCVGYGVGPTWCSIPGVNSPVGPLRNTSYFIYGWPYLDGVSDTNWYPGFYTGTMVFAGTTGADWANRAVLTSEEAYTIDTKGDDGIPGLGNLRAWTANWNGNCVSGTSTQAATSRYRRNVAGQNCVILFMPEYRRPQSVSQ